MAQTLIPQLARAFDRGTLQRGVAYFRDGHVRIDSVSDSRIIATVRGTRRYQVGLERDGEKIRASCTCPYFDVGLCKHICAVTMAAEAKRLFRGIGRDAGVVLVHRDIDDDEFDDGRDFAEPAFLPDGDEQSVDDAQDSDDLEDAPRYPHPLRTGALVSTRLLPGPPASPRKPAAARWRQQLAQLHPTSPSHLRVRHDAWPQKRELLYVIDAAVARNGGSLQLEIFFRDLKRDGTWGKPKSKYLPRELLKELPNVEDRHILAFLAGATQLYSPTDYSYDTASEYTGYGAGYYESSLPFRYRLIEPQPDLILPAICRTGRCRLRLRQEDDIQQWLPVAWQDGDPWQFRLEVQAAPQDERYRLLGVLSRGAERMDLSEPELLVSAGILFAGERAMRYEHHSGFRWIASLRKHRTIVIPFADRDAFLAELWRQPNLPPLDLPDELRYAEVQRTPHPRLVIKADKNVWTREQLHGELTFDYDGTVVAPDEPSRGIVQAAERRVLLRDFAAERAADQRLQQLGCRALAPTYQNPKPKFGLAASRLPGVVQELTTEGWHVEAEGKIYRSSGRLDIQIRSGIDWFELHGAVDFGDSVVQLPELLAAARRGANVVRLGDGTFGVLPQEWLKKYGMLAGLGHAHEDHVRFSRAQVGLLDALLAAQPEARCDALFARMREQLRTFDGIQPADPPAGFRGELRPYQREGLGWLDFLRQFRFGGCLADDMGLGKTVQVLALLEARRGSARSGPSLVVVPKSLVFNWKQEAARFAPGLRVLDHTGPFRPRGVDHFEDYDLVLTTYGTLRNDAVTFKDVRFDYLILDEAQAIKNADSESAKAARLLQGEHRLALSGTPIENHLGELWSLFEFLNPGMLGGASVFKRTHAGARNPDEEARKILAHALRPFLLRRTKEQVARDLPPKLEQTLYCELDSKQRKLYDELRAHYRATLLKRIEKGGIGRAKIQILEALLRLRQAAIHPGLLDKARGREPAAKLDMLLPRVVEVLDEGHKTLVFSQFTGMLAILREHLDRLAIPYEYLDGKTKDRQGHVERFQNDPACKLFLISLKAGGVGLNLTAAQYVFLLDPWWNPAVEAQAIDRAHRIGQTNQVFAYRLIARDTVEEKVLELQNTKRDLADAIVNADNALIRNLGREDLELLLS